ncbi:GntR family transcriptional regulator [Cryptosporangium aurantiacum]|uniref:DNA-binding transcriptional regulator, GntR family n=1 Tax=Cryptosporangium aurantiacum TaxID=134849 RepID=A0A1M7NF95_9ACTN|nr:GntR family transcriptional regulator [Cryptosporangium aurantiacum]SHN02403.1 DNA-binding transcriptional regulator, GntR family [Cryptosporangium aurantiacum]
MQADAAYARLREAIVDGQYPAGSRLTEVEIAEMLGMSRTPVREALRRLAGDGLVRASDRGVIVDLMDDEEARHARTVRASLDVLVAELAARRQKAGQISPAAMRAAEEAAAEAETSLDRGDADAAYRHDQRLHRLIAELAGNPVALQMLDRLADRLEVARLAAGSRAARANGTGNKAGKKKVNGVQLAAKVPAAVGAATGGADAVLSDMNGAAMNGADVNGVDVDAAPADGVGGRASAKRLKGAGGNGGVGQLAVPVLSPELGEEHRRILAAIAAGQPAAAWLAAREHAHG